jgi:hypothetical protein
MHRFVGRARPESHDARRRARNPIVSGTVVMDFLLKIEQSGVSQWIRSSESIVGYTGILLLHTIGMGIVVGVSACIDLRILGFAPALRLTGLAKFFPTLWFGFWLNAISGLILLAIDLTKKLGNPDFYVKMVFIAIAVVTVRMLKTEAFGAAAVDEGPASGKARVLAATSLICWLGAIVSGRLLAYLG